MVQREEMYFEPRCVGSDLRIRWYVNSIQLRSWNAIVRRQFTFGTTEKS